MAAAAPMLYAPPAALDQNPFPASSLPVAGVTSGFLSSGLNYPVLTQLPAGWEGQPPLSPLQQWVPTPEGLLEKLKRNGMMAGKAGKGGGAAAGAAGAGLSSDADDATAAEAAEERLGVGMPVRICNFFTKGSGMYNGLVGDIVSVTTERVGHGEEEFLFDVRCPCNGGDRRRTSGTGANVPISPLAQASVMANRKQIGPQYGVSPDEAVHARDDLRLPPFVLLHRLPSEKLEALT
mmetsp:Transcript_126079/g.299385  ORF Transcript_126079/g.299385 Transcript_126079/m.299385 type:complete len:236 (-) Transcript_126079:43-750(-)